MLEGELFKLIVVVRKYWSSIFHVETTIPQDSVLTEIPNYSSPTLLMREIQIVQVLASS